MNEVANLVLSVFTVAAQVLSVIGIGVMIGYTFNKVKLRIPDSFVLVFVYIVTMIATLGSLFFSDIAGYPPCKLCWYQRIFMYPQAVLYFIAIGKKDMNIGLYGVVLSVVGAAIALYHYLLQLGFIATEGCSTVGYSASCSERFTTVFGYITIPMMALSAFVLILVSWGVYFFARRPQQKD